MCGRISRRCVSYFRRIQTIQMRRIKRCPKVSKEGSWPTVDRDEWANEYAVKSLSQVICSHRHRASGRRSGSAMSVDFRSRMHGSVQG